MQAHWGRSAAAAAALPRRRREEWRALGAWRESGTNRCLFHDLYHATNTYSLCLHNLKGSGAGARSRPGGTTTRTTGSQEKKKRDCDRRRSHASSGCCLVTPPSPSQISPSSPHCAPSSPSHSMSRVAADAAISDGGAVGPAEKAPPGVCPPARARRAAALVSGGRGEVRWLWLSGSDRWASRQGRAPRGRGCGVRAGTGRYPGSDLAGVVVYGAD